MDIYTGQGGILFAGTAPLASQGYGDTQQVGVDNSIILSMRCITGQSYQSGSGYVAI